MTASRPRASLLMIITAGLLSLSTLGIVGAQTKVENFAGFDTVSIPGEIIYSDKNGDFSIPGHFMANRQGTEITADHGKGNAKTKFLLAEGHVVVHQNQPLRNRGGDVARVTDEPSTITCDRLEADGVQKTYTAIGNVHFTQLRRKASAGRAILNDATRQLHLEGGRVHAEDADKSIDADVIDYDFGTSQFKAHGNVLMRFLSQPPEAETAAPKTAAPKRSGK